MTTRREALSALPLLLAGMYAHAQPTRKGAPRRIGVVSEADWNDGPKFWVAMGKRGWFRDENALIEQVRHTEDRDRLARDVDMLTGKAVEVILAIGPDAAIAAARATRTIPVVFFGVFWPLERRLVDSYARSGRNVTGIAGSSGIEATIKRLEFLKQAAPNATRLSWTFPRNFLSLETVSGGRHDMVPTFDAAARNAGFESTFHVVRDWRDLEPLFGELTAARADAVTSFTPPEPRGFAELALRGRLPTAFFYRDAVDAGGLLSYGTLSSEMASLVDRLADYVDRILRGARPEDLPVDRPSRYELVVNVKTAKLLGLSIPPSLLLRADEVIQ